MSHLPIDPEEMAKRLDEDVNAALKMIGEGSPVYESYPHVSDDVIEGKSPAKERDLPETYQ